MSLILSIETSTEICSVSISKNGKLIDLLIDNPLVNGTGTHGQHSKLLAIFIEKILKNNSIKHEDLTAIAISEGPGSYTGLRIGVSTAKGMCFGLEIPLIAINTLKLIAEMAKKNTQKNYDLIIPMIDARRMEVYCSVFNNNLNEITKTEAKIISQDSFSEYKGKKILFCGNGSAKCKDTLSELNADFDNNAYPSAEYMINTANEYFENKNFVDLVYFEPYYLKSFIATKSKKNILT